MTIKGVKLKKTRVKHINNKYSLTEESFIRLFNIQGRRCSICRTEFIKEDLRDVHIDHCHRTGKVRGLLCTFCNKGLGDFKDNIRSLIRAVYYLREQTQDPPFKGKDFPDEILVENKLYKLIKKKE